MNNYFSGEEEYNFPQDSREAKVQPQTDGKSGGVFGKVLGSLKDFFANPSVEEPDDDFDVDSENEDVGNSELKEFPLKTVPFTSNANEETKEKEMETVWSNHTASSTNSIEPKGVRDMPSSIYSKPVFAQRTLSEVKPEELWEIVEKMREGIVVMLNLEACTEADVDKISTFLSGAACYQQGEVRLNGSRNWVLTPPNTEIDSDHEPKRGGSSFLP